MEEIQLSGFIMRVKLFSCLFVKRLTVTPMISFAARHLRHLKTNLHVNLQ